jgi:acetyltransferase-like isoleucine patch superfamily enzyme
MNTDVEDLTEIHHSTGRCLAGGSAGVTFDDFSGCAYGCHVLTQSDDYSGAALTNPTVPQHFKNETFSAVRIGRHAILGTGTIVLPGSDIGDGVSTCAGTVVTKPLAEWTVYVGQPARAVGSRSRQLLNLEAKYLAEER